MGRLADAFEARRMSQQGPKCGVARLLRALDDEDRADLQAMLDGPRKSTDLARFINDELHDEVRAVLDGQIQHQTLARHRRGDCHCGTAR